MLAHSVRSGIVETYHDGAIVAVASDGRELLSVGDVDREFWLRSAIKPFQTTVSLEAGADLNREQIALAAGSHGGQPVHIAVVGSILAEIGLTPDALQCPPAWPLSSSARDRAIRREVEPRSIYHNCSGKHAAALAACAVQGWPTQTYLQIEHPYQQRVIRLLEETTGASVTPPGIDGCGFPTMRGSVRSLARAFTHLGADRFQPVSQAMMAAPALSSDQSRADAAVSTWLAGVAKVGAEACAGVYLPERGAVAVKCWDGNGPAMWVGLIEALDLLGVLEPVTKQGLVPHVRPEVVGGGRPVGELQPALP